MCRKNKKKGILCQVNLDESEIKQTIDILKFISTTYRTEFHKRRDTEWGVIFPILTLYAAISYFLLRKDGISLENIPLIIPFLLIGFCLLSAVVTIIYLWFIHYANKLNKEKAQEAEEILLDMVRISVTSYYREKLQNKEVCCIYKCFRSRWSFIGQSITIFTFAILSSLIIIFQFLAT